MEFEFKVVRGHELTPFLDQLAQLRINVFREFPYLYDGNIDYETEYLSVYQNTNESMVILVYLNSKLIGASTCIPLSCESDEFKDNFLKNDFNLDKIMYFGESILLKEYRGNKIGHRFFEMRESFAQKQIKDLEVTTFCAVDRPVNHPLRPAGYQGLATFWMRMGYEKTEMKVYYPWKDIDQKEENNKAMSIWIKKWK